MLNYVYGSSERIFLNTTIGCNAMCKYCYLPSIQSDTSNLLYKKSVDKVYKSLVDLSYFVDGENGTILSLGCYSECMDKENVQQTQVLLKKIILLGNRIQLATKQKIPEKIVQEISILRKYRSQVMIYVSMPTVSSIGNIEPGTASYEMRILNFELCKKYGVPAVLYIKPFLKGMTDRDIDKYVEIVQKYQIPVVVGNYLSPDLREKTQADVGEGLLYEQGDEEDIEKFIRQLERYTKVYRHSVMCMSVR